MTAVTAFAWLMLPVAHPYGDIIRSNRTGCPPASTMAILTGLRSSFARCLLASRILRARSIVRLTALSFVFDGYNIEYAAQGFVLVQV
jgi:hypothetical protein